VTSSAQSFPSWRQRSWQLARFCRHRFWPRASYADDREDEVMWYLLSGVRRFIDVGANDGLTCSNTALAAFRGAYGLCFEPNPSVYKSLAGFYRLNSRIECIPEGLSDTNSSLELRCDGLLSSITMTEDTKLTNLLRQCGSSTAPRIQVNVSRLGDWLERRPDFVGCDLLSIDVEGHELSVLRGLDWIRVPSPARALIIETHAEGESGSWRHRDFDAIATLLDGHGYAKVAGSRNNTIWLHGGDPGFVRLESAKKQFSEINWY